jgi:hypothetical protein
MLTVRSRQTSGDLTLRVVGVYDLVDPHEDYWAGSPLVNVPSGADGKLNGDPVFTVPET